MALCAARAESREEKLMRFGLVSRREALNVDGAAGKVKGFLTDSAVEVVVMAVAVAFIERSRHSREDLTEET